MAGNNLIQFLRGTNAQINSSQEVANAGQPVYSTDGKYLLIGDGSTQIRNLEPILGTTGPTGPTGPRGYTGSRGATGPTGPQGEPGETPAYGYCNVDVHNTHIFPVYVRFSSVEGGPNRPAYQLSPGEQRNFEVYAPYVLFIYTDDGNEWATVPSMDYVAGADKYVEGFSIAPSFMDAATSGRNFAGSVVSLTAAGSGTGRFADSFDNITIQLIPIRPNNTANVPIIHV